MRFTTEKHPNLAVKFGRGPLVQFERGEAEVEGDVARRLASFADRLPDYGITYDEADLPEPEREEPEGTPATDEDYDALTDDEVLDAYVTTFGGDDVPEDREAAVAALKALDES